MSFVADLEGSVAAGHEGILGAVSMGFGRVGSDITDFYKRGIGKQAWDSDQDINFDSTFWAYSCTKLLTTIAALQSIERGLISLDDDVSNILPELKDVQIISKGDTEDDFKLAAAQSKITLRQLLSHTSGINYDAMNPLTLAWRKSRGEGPLVFSGRLKDSYSTPLLFEPGQGWVYGGGIDWAGVLVSRVNNGVPLGVYMEKNIFQVLGLKSSTFDIKTRPELESRLIQLNTRGSDGLLKPSTSPYNDAAPDHSGGTGLVTSSSDFSTVLKDLLKPTPALLKAETVDSMFEPQFPLGSVQHKGLLAQHSLHSQLTGDKSENTPVSFGLGGLVTVEAVPNLPKGTLTWNGMPNIGWYVHREKGLGGLFVTQVLPASDEVCVKLLGSMAQTAWHNYELHAAQH